MKKKCYVSTPIYYASGNVQIGNTYSTVAADVYARFNRNLKRETFFLTGMDEHGQKIEEAALKAKMEPKKIVIHNTANTATASNEIKWLHNKLNTSLILLSPGLEIKSING